MKKYYFIILFLFLLSSVADSIYNFIQSIKSVFKKTDSHTSELYKDIVVLNKSMDFSEPIAFPQDAPSPGSLEKIIRSSVFTTTSGVYVQGTFNGISYKPDLEILDTKSHEEFQNINSYKPDKFI